MTTTTMSRWYPLRPHTEQRALWTSSARFRVAACGRRSGKTELAKRFAVTRALSPHTVPDYRVLLGSPTWQQARKIFWSDLKAMCPTWALRGQDRRKAISEGQMTVDLMNGGQIVVTGLDVAERAEGVPLDFVVVDEAADTKESAWLEHIRPGLSERAGEAWIISTPEGRNWLWRLAQQAQQDETGLWDFFTWPSADILPPEEIEIAKAELDERTFQQEYEASFLDVTGRVYYSFERDIHASERLEYRPVEPLYLALDFNVSPGVAVILQERLYEGKNPAVDRDTPVTMVVDEIWIKDNSNTVRVCEEFLSRYRSHRGQVRLYGDASGGARGTAKVEGSDWDLVDKALRPVFGRQQFAARNGKAITTASRLVTRVPATNPAVRQRINATNARLRSVDGTIRLLVDPRCRHTIEDLEGVTWSQDGTDIDKKGSPMLSHLSDALGYYLHREHPIVEHLSTWQQV